MEMESRRQIKNETIGIRKKHMRKKWLQSVALVWPKRIFIILSEFSHNLTHKRITYTLVNEFFPFPVILIKFLVLLSFIFVQFLFCFCSIE